MTSNTICSYCKNEHTITSDLVCSVGEPYVSKPYFAMEINIKNKKITKKINRNIEAIDYCHSIKGFGGTQNKL